MLVLILINLLSLAMFGVTCYAMAKLSLTTGIVFTVIWLLYTIISNIYLYKHKLSAQRLEHSGNSRIFKKQIDLINMQYDSIKSREEFFNTKTSESMMGIYNQILEQMQSNINSANAYIESYDYITHPEPTYLNNICYEGNTLVNKFNILVEKIIDLDTNLTELDMKYVDDVVSSLEEMRNLKV